jgi:hypothetical protein
MKSKPKTPIQSPLPWKNAEFSDHSAHWIEAHIAPLNWIYSVEPMHNSGETPKYQAFLLTEGQDCKTLTKLLKTEEAAMAACERHLAETNKKITALLLKPHKKPKSKPKQVC